MKNDELLVTLHHGYTKNQRVLLLGKTNVIIEAITHDGGKSWYIKYKEKTKGEEK